MEETEFLAAYAKLAAMVHPTTAATLRATSRTVRRPWVWRRFSNEPISEAQRVAYRFGLLALILILVIGGAEWTRTFINSVVTDQAEHTRVMDELRTTRAAQKRLVEQIALLDRERQGTADSLRAGLVRHEKNWTCGPAPGRRARPSVPAHPGRLETPTPSPFVNGRVRSDRAGGHDRVGAGAPGL